MPGWEETGWSGQDAPEVQALGDPRQRPNHKPRHGHGAFVALLSVLWPIWDPLNQTLHDKVVRSVATVRS